MAESSDVAKNKQPVRQDNSKPMTDSEPRKKRCFESWYLFGGTREILIRHQGQEYRLLITKTEKLILNK